jgi:polysaccharide biosynthesis/export protein
MRPSRLILILMAAFTAAGCMQTTFAPDSGAVSRAGLTVPPNLDSIAYERSAAPPAAAYAQAQPPAQRPPHVQTRAQPNTAMQAHAQAPVIPVVARPEPPYALDTGDKLRIVVFGQEGLSNSYFVDAAGQVTIPLIGAVTARGLTTQALARAVAAKLRAGFIREPHVAIEVETYRPFFILGEVTQPGQYPYVPNMTVETAVAIAGGFTPRAYRYDVNVDRQAPGATVRGRSSVPLLTRVQPGDTIIIKERWF